MKPARRCARRGSGSSSCGSFGAAATTKSGVRAAAVGCAVFAGAAGLGAAAAAAGAGVAFGSPTGTTDVPKYGETSSGSPFSGYAVRSSVTVIVGAPVSLSFVPAAGICFRTLLAAYPCTLPTTFQAKPVSSSVPFAKTNACPVTSGTTTVATATGAGAPWGTAAIRLAAPTASVALARRSTAPTTARRGKRVAIRRAMLWQSAGNGLNSTPGAGEGHYLIPRLRDDGEHPLAAVRRRPHQGADGGRERRRLRALLCRLQAGLRLLECLLCTLHRA